MPSKRTTISIDKELYKKAEAKLKKQCYKNLNEYIIYLIRRDLFKPHGKTGRPLTGIERDVATLTSQTPVFTEEKSWFKKKKK